MKTFDYRWEEVHKNREWGRYPSEDIIRFVARNYYKMDRKKIKILDVGCGQGANTWYIAREGFDTYAFDGAKSAVDKARKNLSEEKLKAEISVADASDTGYNNNFFDCIIDGAVIYANTLDGIKSILKEMYRILKIDGKLFSTGLFNRKTTGYGTGEIIEKNTERNLKTGTLQELGTVHFFDKEEIINIWRECGFANIKIDSVERTDYDGKYITGYYIVEATKK